MRPFLFSSLGLLVLLCAVAYAAQEPLEEGPETRAFRAQRGRANPAPASIPR